MSKRSDQRCGKNKFYDEFTYLVEGTHGSTGWGNHIVDEEEESVFWSQMDAFADEKVKLSNSQIRGNQVFFLVQISNTSFGSFLHNYLFGKQGLHSKKKVNWVHT